MVTNKVESIIRKIIKEQNTQVLNSEGQSLEEPPPPKRSKSQIWNTYTEILKETGAHIEESKNDELEIYLAEHLIPMGKESCYQWWSNNSKWFPHMAKLAIKYLCAPPT